MFDVTAPSRRARTGRLLPYHDDAFRRVAVRAATDAQAAEAATRAAVFMLRLYVVCLVFPCVFQF